MPQLTKYDSYESLKSDTNQAVENEQQAIDRQRAMQDFFALLRDKLLDKKTKEAHTTKQAVSDEQ